MAIEAVLLAPLLILQVLLFPFVANSMSSYWANATREVTLQETASQMGSTIQQLYISLSRAEVSPGIVTQASTFPSEIGSHNYLATGSLTNSLKPNSSRILHLNLTLDSGGSTVTVQTPLGPNVLWNKDSVFYSSSPSASIKVQKFVNDTLLFSFG